MQQEERRVSICFLTYRSPTEPGTDHLWSYTDPHNSVPVEEGWIEKKRRTRKGRQKKDMCFSESRGRIGEKWTTLPVRHHTCSRPVCGRYEDTAGVKESITCSQSHQASEIWSFKSVNRCVWVVSFTWLESPVQVSAMSQSLTASRHITPLSSYFPQKKTKKQNQKQPQPWEVEKEK